MVRKNVCLKPGKVLGLEWENVKKKEPKKEEI